MAQDPRNTAVHEDDLVKFLIAEGLVLDEETNMEIRIGVGGTVQIHYIVHLTHDRLARFYRAFGSYLDEVKAQK